jgi:2-dehydro-3-deoxyphosphooctonate aldolase (KDO 8-P synthase)
MRQKTVTVSSVRFSNDKLFVLIAGPCVIESRAHAFKMARALKALTEELNIPFVFKASYDKANRTSVKSFRGIGVEQGLDVLAGIKSLLNVPVISDVHSESEVRQAAAVLDIIQIPAFLSRQTDLLLAAGGTQKIINIKKGQFMAPWDLKQAVAKVESTGNKRILLTERGVSFGYNTLVSDFRALPVLRETGYPVVFDATHSVQQPGGRGASSGGQSEYVPLLARCAVAAGCASVFMEVHDRPRKALSDGTNVVALRSVRALLLTLQALDRVIKRSAR